MLTIQILLSQFVDIIFEEDEKKMLIQLGFSTSPCSETLTFWHQRLAV